MLFALLTLVARTTAKPRRHFSPFWYWSFLGGRDEAQ